MRLKTRNMHSIKPPTGRFVFLLIVLAAACIIFFGRLFNLQFASGDVYSTGISSVNTTVAEIPTVRGIITDVNGVVLASNQNFNSITLDKKQIPAESRASVALSLCNFFIDNSVEYRDVLPVSARYPYTLDADYHSSSEKQKYLRSYAKYMGIQEEKLTATDTALYDTLVYRNGLSDTQDYSPEQVRLIVGLLFTLDVNAYSSNLPCVLVENVSDAVVAKIADSFHKFPGLEISTGTKRVYNIDRLASHLLGRTGNIYAEDASYYADRGYSMNETVGKEGAEKAFEEYLRGINGKKEITTSLDGKELIEEKVIREPKAGYTVSLTIDADMQATAEAALEKTIKAQAAKGAAKPGRKDGEDANAGAVVVMDPRNGAVRVLASYPTYSLNTFSEDIEQLGKDSKNTPLVNRATGGIYEPGSTFKIATAAAALHHGVTTFDELIYDKGEYDFHETYKPHCWIYANGVTHGYQNVVMAIQNSCNYYFFEMGNRLGIDKINEYAKSLGLGVRTGIETGEAGGVLISPQYMEANGLAWNPGYVLQAAIGQQHLFTPVQIASYISTFINGGKRYKAHLFDHASDYATGETVAQYSPELLSDAAIPYDTVTTLKEGMKKVIDEGTASAVFTNYKYPVGGKTGTAQVSNGSNNVVFVGFAPYENPEIVVTVVLEHGHDSKNAATVAREIFDCYFKKLYPLDFGIAVVNPDGSITNPDGTVTNPDGSVVNTDGSVTRTDGSILRTDGSIKYPDGSVLRTDGTIKYTDGSIKNPDGSITYPDGKTAYTDGHIKNPDGTIKNVDGSVTRTDGTVKYPDGSIKDTDGTIRYPDGTTRTPDGTLLDRDGNAKNEDHETPVPPAGANAGSFESDVPNNGLTVDGNQIMGDLAEDQIEQATE